MVDAKVRSPIISPLTSSQSVFGKLLILLSSVVTPLDMPLDFRNGPNIRCIKFFEDIPGRMKSLYIGGKLVQRFAWKDTEEEDP